MHVRMTSTMSSVEWTDLDFKISVALVATMYKHLKVPNFDQLEISLLRQKKNKKKLTSAELFKQTVFLPNSQF